MKAPRAWVSACWSLFLSAVWPSVTHASPSPDEVPWTWQESFEAFEGNGVAQDPIPGDLDGQLWSVSEETPADPVQRRSLSGLLQDGSSFPKAKPGIYSVRKGTSHGALGVRPGKNGTSVSLELPLQGDGEPGCDVFVQYVVEAWMQAAITKLEVSWALDDGELQGAPAASAEWRVTEAAKGWSPPGFRLLHIQPESCGQEPKKLRVRWAVPASRRALVVIDNVVVSRQRRKAIVLTEVDGAVDAGADGGDESEFLRSVLQYYLRLHSGYDVVPCRLYTQHVNAADQQQKARGGEQTRESILDRIAQHGCAAPPISQFYTAQMTVHVDVRNKRREVLLAIRNVDDPTHPILSGNVAEHDGKELSWSYLTEQVVRKLFAKPEPPRITLDVPALAKPGTVTVSAANGSGEPVPWRLYYCLTVRSCDEFEDQLRRYWRCRRRKALDPRSRPSPRACSVPEVGPALIPANKTVEMPSLEAALRAAEADVDKSDDKRAQPVPAVDCDDREASRTDADADGHERGVPRPERGDGSDSRVRAASGQCVGGPAPKTADTDHSEDGEEDLAGRPWGIDLQQGEQTFRAVHPGHYLVVAVDEGHALGESRVVEVPAKRHNVELAVGAGTLGDGLGFLGAIDYHFGGGPISFLTPHGGLQLLVISDFKRQHRFIPNVNVGFVARYIPPIAVAIHLGVGPDVQWLTFHETKQSKVGVGLVARVRVFYDEAPSGGDQTWLAGVMLTQVFTTIAAGPGPLAVQLSLGFRL